MRIPPPSSQTSSRPGIATRKSEGGILRLHVDDRGGGGARETREREQGRVSEESGTGRAKKPDAAPSSLSTRGPVFYYIFLLRRALSVRVCSPRITLYYNIFFYFHQADLRSINDNHNKGVVERTYIGVTTTYTLLLYNIIILYYVYIV